MIKLKTIKLKNFQAHKDLTIDFNEDVNTITGLSNKGKSCVRRAIDWVIFCLNISENDLRREGTKTTSVTLIFNNGVEVEKVRSSSINRYVLRKLDEEEQVFDSFGKTTPEEVRNAIGMSEIDIEKESLNLNIAEQLTLPFLLDKSPSFRAKLFNKLTGNELLDSLFKKCNKESLRLGRELKSTEELLIKQENDVFEYGNQYKVNRNKLACVTEDFAELKKKDELFGKLSNIALNLEEKRVDIKIISDELSAINTINEETICDLYKKAKIYTQYTEISTNLQEINKALDLMPTIDISAQPISFDALRKKIELFERLNELLNKNRANTDDSDMLEESIVDVINTIGYDETQLKELWSKCKTCPLCKGKIKHESI